MNNRRTWILAVGLLSASCACADLVHVATAKSVDGGVTLLTDEVVETGRSFETGLAPSIPGQIFIGWRIDTIQQLTTRDTDGRSLDVVKFVIYEQTTAIAEYLPNSCDTDQDGIPDGYELYWYGHLDETATSDTDGDGYTFAAELALNQNPLFPNAHLSCGVETVEVADVLYNPQSVQSWTIRSEPEGCLFATQRDYAKQGTVKTTNAYNPSTSTFAYWMVNGVVQRDSDGRALDAVTFVIGTNAVEAVAVCMSEAAERYKLYWYGRTDVALDSDFDHDGYTLAAEFALGQNPHFQDHHLSLGVAVAEFEGVLYNPECIQEVTIRSEPEGRLFATRKVTVKPGTMIATDAFKPGVFAYWTINGVAQRDADGRAFDQVVFKTGVNPVEVVAVCCADTTQSQKLYWYGTTEIALDSDTDRDGFTLAAELALDLNPLLPDKLSGRGVVTAESAGEGTEMNLQVYEQVRGALVGGVFADLFTSPIAGTDGTVFFGGTPIWPIVTDLNNDGLFDIVIESVDSGARIVYQNVGVLAGPEFEVRPWSDEWEPLIMANRHASTDATLDTPIVNGLSCTHGDADRDGVADLLASDVDGRIWYYRGMAAASPVTEDADGAVSYQLQHKVWGGSYAGFAQGLRIAAVDWDDDGDLDCLAGTAEGKLMLLRDPKVGRPTNLKALVGVDNVKLDWDPNQQSRIRGYKVYRADAGAAEFASLVSPYTPLPTYRDYPPSVSDFDYKVSSVSRHYVAGNSTPIESESPATEAVRASLGKVKFFWNDVAVKQGERAEVLLSIENSLNYDVAGKTQVVTYDPAYLTPLKIVKTGLTENVIYEESVADGKWTISLKSGKLEAGGGKFLTLVFDTLKPGTTRVGEATVTIVARQEPAPYRLGDVTGDGVVDTLDLRELAKLKSAVGRKWTANQLKAGDFNGNGLLDNADYQALRAMLKERGML